MNCRLLFLTVIVSATILPDGPVSAAPTNQPPAKRDYAFFNTIPDRNIFNPNRYPHRIIGRGDAARGPALDAIALVGVMSYEKGTFAFFAGPTAEYQKALRRDEMIAGFQVSAIRGDAVTLTASNRTVELPVGRQLVRAPDAGWQLAPETETPVIEPVPPARADVPMTTADATFAIAPSAPPPPAAASEPSSDVLKRLMQRREQELK